MKNLLFSIFLSSLLLADTYYYNNNKKVSLSKIVNIQRENYKIDYYIDKQKNYLGVSNRVIVKLKNNVIIDKYLKEFDATLEKKLTSNIYLLKVKNKTLTLNISNRLNEKVGVEYAHPDFIKKSIRR